jgi:F0F1-type ATP synthase delta subunit
MKGAREILALRYAQAFLNCFIDEIDRAYFTALCEVELYFRSNKKVLYFLSLSNIDQSMKETLMHTLFEQFGIARTGDRLVHTLLVGKRGHLLHAVLKHIISLYKRRTQIMSFLITTSHPVSNAQIAVIQQFLARASGCDIIYEYAVNKRLIAGIRLQSDLLLWEYSIDKQLKSMSHPITT